MAKFTYDQSDEFGDKVTLLSGSASLTFSYNVSYRSKDLGYQSGIERASFCWFCIAYPAHHA